MSDLKKIIEDGISVESNEKDSQFYENAVVSIQKVINHFSHTPEAFEGLSIESLKSINEDSSMGTFVVKVINGIARGDYEFPEYQHTFQRHDFKTKYIINPFSEVLSNYERESGCEINLTPEGHLKTVKFAEFLKSGNKMLWIVYTDSFEIESVARSYLNFENGTFKDIVMKVKSYCESIESESYFLGLFLRDADKKLLEHLPEYTIPSAYNFNTDEFAMRLKIAEMMLI